MKLKSQRPRLQNKKHENVDLLSPREQKCFLLFNSSAGMLIQHECTVYGHLKYKENVSRLKRKEPLCSTYSCKLAVFTYLFFDNCSYATLCDILPAEKKKKYQVKILAYQCDLPIYFVLVSAVVTLGKKVWLAAFKFLVKQCVSRLQATLSRVNKMSDARESR